MSEIKNGATPVADADMGAQARRRQYRITARVLREYTARLYEIARVVCDYADGRTPPGSGGQMPWSVLVAANRYEAVKQEVTSLALYASQMLVQFDFDEAESAELRLRLFDAEEVVRLIGDILERLDKAGHYKAYRQKPHPNSPLGTGVFPGKVQPRP